MTRKAKPTTVYREEVTYLQGPGSTRTTTDEATFRSWVHYAHLCDAPGDSGGRTTRFFVGAVAWEEVRP